MNENDHRVDLAGLSQHWRSRRMAKPGNFTTLQMRTEQNVNASAWTKPAPVCSTLSIEWTGLERWLGGEAPTVHAWGPEFESLNPFQSEQVRTRSVTSGPKWDGGRQGQRTSETLRPASLTWAAVSNKDLVSNRVGVRATLSVIHCPPRQHLFSHARAHSLTHSRTMCKWILYVHMQRLFNNLKVK